MRSPLLKTAGIVLLAGLLSACTTPPKKEAKKDDTEYVWYTPTGSHIPIKVPKDSLKASDADGDKVRDTFSGLQQKGQRAPRDNPGGQ